MSWLAMRLTALAPACARARLLAARLGAASPATACCLGQATAPRAEATALLLALRWLRQLLTICDTPPWAAFEYAYIAILCVYIYI